MSSPAGTYTSASSFSELTIPSSSSADPFETFDESEEDEVVWTGNELDSEDDFILVPQSRPTATVPDTVEAPVAALSQLFLGDVATPTTPTKHSKGRSKPKNAGKSRRSATGRPLESVPTPPATAPRTPRSRRHRRKRDAAASYPSPSPSPVREGTDHPTLELGDSRFGERLVVEESDGDEPVMKCYEDAVQYITSFLASQTGELSPSACTRLKFLQSLIIELGLIDPTSTPPSSLSSAKRFLKTRAFVNISRYLSVRGQGLEQLRSVMYNSRRELATDLRRRRAPKADKGWVKRHGLNVLLVSVF